MWVSMMVQLMSRVNDEVQLKIIERDLYAQDFQSLTNDAQIHHVHRQRSVIRDD